PRDCAAHRATSRAGRRTGGTLRDEVVGGPMDELELVGLHDDGEHVVLTGPDGERFKLRIDETLRAAVRRDRPRLELLRAEGGTALPPREIQARIRAGGTAEEVAESGGIAVELVRRYEGPVLAEREFVAGQARASRVGREKDSP